jgi:hypothetical protein
MPVDDVDDYFKETVRLMRQCTLFEQLDAMLKEAEEFENRGVSMLDAWRNDVDWQRLGRMTLVANSILSRLEDCMSYEREAAWRERLHKRRSIRRVK